MMIGTGEEVRTVGNNRNPHGERSEGGTARLGDLPVYTGYNMSLPEYIATVLLTALAIFSLLFIFYRSYIISLIFTPLAFIFPKMRCKKMANKKRTDLKLQFRDMLYSMSSSLMAGRPLESAFMDIRDDLEILYPDEDTPIRKEVGIIIRKIALNESVEDALTDLSERSKIDDIESFCNVLVTSRRTGGNLVEIVKNTSNILGDKLEIKQEIDIMLAARKLEKNILNVMPIALILILSLVAGDYIEPVYTTLMGRLVMTCAAVMMIISWFVSGKIMNIEV